jgi:branched-chain amino acid transport system substrate-binding protein
MSWNTGVSLLLLPVGRAFVVTALCVWVLGLGGCASAPGKDSAPTEITAGRSDELFDELALRFDAGRYQSADSLAREIYATYPDFPRGDEVLYIAARSSYSIESYTQTVKYAGELSAKFPLSPRLEETLFLGADAEQRLGRHYESAEKLSHLLELPLDPEKRERCTGDLRLLTEEKLGAAELERLAAAYPDSPVAAELSLGIARKEFAGGDYEGCYALLSDFLSRFPEHGRAREAKYLLEASDSRRRDPEHVTAYVEPNKIGILLPYTGEYSRFGRYFEEGVRLAVDEHNAGSGIRVTLALGDTKADPITAVTAVRRLVVEEGVVAVLGAVFTIPSIVAATECNARKVPIVSPLVTDRRLRDIGPWVFQTQPPVDVEVSALAILAVEELLLERVAVLAPSTPEGRRLSRFFAGEIERRGGAVVIEEFFNAGDTDFREELSRIKAGAPDGMFIPGGPDELVNILPQIRFYDLQVQLLGLSSWNSEKLLRLAGSELEGAVFAREGYYGKDPEAYRRFAVKYLETHARDASVSGIDDVPPIAAAGYFGSRFLLDAIARGAVDREQMRGFLAEELDATAEVRLREVDSLPLLQVRSGTPRDFRPPRSERE